MIQVRILFFASTREITGIPLLDITADEGESIESILETKVFPLFPALSSDAITRYSIALNKKYVNYTEIVKDGDELALLPPISGG